MFSSFLAGWPVCAHKHVLQLALKQVGPLVLICMYYDLL